MKIQELVYNRPNLIRSQVGSVSLLVVCLFRIFFFSLQLMCVFSSVQAKSKTEQCQCAFKYHSSARKRERESAILMRVFSLVLAYVSIYIFVCIYMYVLVCVSVRQGVHICVAVSMCRWGVGVSCVLVCRRPWMLSRLQLGTAMVHVQCRKQ